MKLLFDIISLQGYHNGGEEYVRKLFYEIINSNNGDIECLYDSSLKFLDNDECYFKRNFKLHDVHERSIGELISSEHFDVFFIGIAQRYLSYNLYNINCKVICVVHDIGDLVYHRNNIFYHFRPSFKRFISVMISYLRRITNRSLYDITERRYNKLFQFLSKKNVEVITVSNYSRDCIKYFCPNLINKEIKVLYPPIKSSVLSECLPNPILPNTFDERKPFILLVNGNRPNKNLDILINVFHRVKQEFNSLSLIITGNTNMRKDGDILYLPYVDSVTIEYLYKNAWCLMYPSFTEGFGYPPLEAMKYGTPVISSNVCSMPEILGDSAVWFSPFYEEDLYSKILYLRENYLIYKSRSLSRIKFINERQIHDFNGLVKSLV